MQEAFRDYIRQQNIFNPGQKILLAVSGGRDSVVMAHLFKREKISFEIAHCNFGLRGEESKRDERFVAELAQKLNVPFHVTNFDTNAYAEEFRQSIQVAARSLRYEWLEKIRAERDLDYIATAHHMQDNVETVLMNLSKGTGIAGLHGILPKSGRIIRPLLFATREEIDLYEKEKEIAFVEDSSNITEKYTRNYFRHQVLPKLQEAYPEAIRNIGGSIERLREVEILYREAVETHRKKLLEKRGEEHFIPILKLQKSVPLSTITYELLKPFGCNTAQAQQVVDMLDSSPGKYLSTQTHRIYRDRKWLIITPQQTDIATHFVIEEEQEHVLLPNGQINITYKDATGDKPPQAATIGCLDIKHLKFPLLVRKWKKGDYFYPLGMQKKKKLSRFFIDQKLSIPQKENTWVIESDKKIVWVVGMRIDDRFKLSPQTKSIVQLEWRPA
ncbi:tRNA lysidine(34) synthetase TilS [uncultured Chitinophaga sp.]|uniref:tRNA lysidine(34) synthetase TilS n=1 Tax=uncultured Chitinophaga sp. TaxID=339340 RepID=UPI0025D34809|nr:tRNA lysidine(34) synthetase TilS [uncultured Chitinophaga sp.]